MASNDAPRLKITAYNNLETVKVNFQITFDQFSARVAGDTFDTNHMFPPCKRDPLFFIRFQANYNNNAYLYLYIQSAKKKYSIESTTWIVNSTGGKYNPLKYSFSLGQDANYTIFSINRNALISSSNSLLPNDKLTFYCEFSFTMDHNFERIVLESAEAMDKFVDEKEQILADYLDILENGKFSDFKLVIGDKELLVHKNVLAARSKVFAAMFEHDSKEAIEGKVEITDGSVEVYQELLRYIYTSKIPPMDKFAADLLVAADKYQLESLKAVCEECLCSQLTPDSVHSLWNLADLHSAPKLKQMALEYIRSYLRSHMRADHMDPNWLANQHVASPPAANPPANNVATPQAPIVQQQQQQVQQQQQQPVRWQSMRCIPFYTII